MNKQDISRRGFLAASLAGLGAAAAKGTATATGTAAGAASDGSDGREFPSQEAALSEAWRLLEEDGACRVIVKDRAIVSVERGRGAGPFMRLLDAQPQALRGAVVVDSVVGAASAAVAVKGGAARVLARTASEAARDVLAAGGVPLEAKVVVPHIMNRDMTGICPLEASAQGLSDPGEIVASARRALDAMRRPGKEMLA